MTTLEKAAQQALEALMWHDEGMRTRADSEAITALKAALAQQQEQEPVATKVSANGSFLHHAWEEVPIGASLYTTPPRREWQSLTDEEISRAYFASASHTEYARAVEAALKERNNG
jgi:hypothetical protein